MKKIKIIIERSSDSFSAYAPDVDSISGMGDSVSLVKKAVLECIELVKGFNGENRPRELDEAFEIEWHYDVASLVENYKNVITRSGLAKKAGINETLLNQYAMGLKKPRPVQREKIEAALHELGRELMAIKL